MLRSVLTLNLVFITSGSQNEEKGEEFFQPEVYMNIDPLNGLALSAHYIRHDVSWVSFLALFSHAM